jgi:hypothetical protein
MPTLLKEPPADDQVDDFEPIEPPSDGGGDEGDDGPSDGPWVTVAVYYHPTGAHLAQLHLETQGIASIILDENMATTLVATAVGGIKLQVRESDATRARELLRRDVVAVRNEGGDEGIACPHCGSTDTVAIRRPSWTLLVAATIATFGLILIALPWLLAVPARWRRCLKCGHGWMRQGAGFPMDGPKT